MGKRPGNSDVAIFWDYENCPAPASASGWETVREIRNVAQTYGSVKLFKAYLELPGQISSSESRSLYLRSELQSSGVSLTDCPHNGRKDVADKMMLVDMMAHAIDNPAPLTYIIITGDRDFAYAISVLRLRCYEIILVTPSSAHSSLTSQPTTCLSWNDLLERIRSQAKESDHPPPTPRRQQRERVSPPTSPLDRITVLNEDGIVGPYQTSDDSGEVDLANYLAPESRQRNYSTTSRTSGSPSLGESARDEVMTVHSDETLANGNTIGSGNGSALDERFQYEGIPYQPEGNERAGVAGIQINHDLYTAAMTSTTRLSFGKFEDDSQPGSSPSEQTQATPPDNGASSSTETLPPAAPTFTPNNQNQNQPSPPPSATGTGSDKAQEIPQTPKKPGKPKVPETPKTSQPALPPAYQPLVRILKKYTELGFPRPPRSRIAVALGKDVYKAAGVEKFGQYVAVAENAGMVMLGGREAEAWIALRPEWF